MVKVIQYIPDVHYGYHYIFISYDYNYIIHDLCFLFDFMFEF